jgi:hypothetical protein
VTTVEAASPRIHSEAEATKAEGSSPRLTAFGMKTIAETNISNHAVIPTFQSPQPYENRAETRAANLSGIDRRA